MCWRTHPDWKWGYGSTTVWQTTKARDSVYIAVNQVYLLGGETVSGMSKHRLTLRQYTVQTQHITTRKKIINPKTFSIKVNRIPQPRVSFKHNRNVD